MTKLLHVSDLHANKRWFAWLADHAEKYDVIAYTGDFLDNYGRESLGSQVRWITDWARVLPRPLLWCSGNQDVESEAAPVSCGGWMAALPKTEAFGHTNAVERPGQSFVRLDWQGSLPKVLSGDIVLAHAPPAGCFTATTKGGMDNGDLNLGDALRTRAVAPWLVLSGHVHSPARWKDRCEGTISLNPGVNEGAEVPNYITVDTVTRKARWFRDGELADVVSLPH